jgi:uncharacterized protein (TIGR02646 family)
MEYINKRVNEPRKLVKFRRRYKLNEKIRLGKKIKFNDLDQTIVEHLRNVLLEDQGYICCYCQKRIPENILPKSKIEHFLCQEENKENIFSFRNLFIACNGKVGIEETCDTVKKSKTLKSVDFLNHSVFDSLKYTKTGVIYSDRNTDLNEDLETLNLNNQNLRTSRKAICEAAVFIKQKISAKRGDFNMQIEKVIQEWKTKDKRGKFKEYKGAGLYYLR